MICPLCLVYMGRTCESNRKGISPGRINTPDDSWRPTSGIVVHDPEIVFVSASASYLVSSPRPRHGSAFLRLLNPVLGAPTQVSMLCLHCVMFRSLPILVFDLGFCFAKGLGVSPWNRRPCSLVYSRLRLAPVCT